MNDSAATTLERPAPRVTSLAPDLSLLGVALIWGINIPLMKIGLEQINVFVFNAVRLSISAVVLLGLAWQERRRGYLPKPGIAWWQLVIYALMVAAVYQVLFLVGIHWTTAGNTALIIATVPMWTALLARFFLGERLQRIAWCGLLLALTGTLIVAVQKGDVASGSAYLRGNLMILAAALIWAGGTVYSRPLLRHITPMQLAATASVIGLPVHLALASGQPGDLVLQPSSVPLWLIILYSGVLSSGMAQPMWHFGVRHAGAAHASVIQNLIPLVAILAAWSLRGVPPTSPQLLGGSLIVVGMVMMRRGRTTITDLTRSIAVKRDG